MNHNRNGLSSHAPSNNDGNSSSFTDDNTDASFGINSGLLILNSPGAWPAGSAGTSSIIDCSIVLLGPSNAGKGSGGTSGGTTGTLSTATTTSSTSPFVINITWDSSVASAPTGFIAGVNAAVQFLESQFTDAVTINISVGYGESGGSSLGGGTLGQTESYLQSVSYSTLINALKADAKTATDSSVIASLPATNPNGGAYWTTTAEAKALGLASATGTSTDAYVGFSSASGIFDYNNTDGVTAGTYDFNGVVLHELTEAMGRMLLTGSTVGSSANSYDTLDLLHYSSVGTRDFSSSTPGYLSFDGGVTNSNQFNTVSGGDAGDLSSSMGNDSLDAFANSGVVNAFTAADLAEMDAIGWNLGSGSGTVTQPPATSQPTGVAIAPATRALASVQSVGGLADNGMLATVTQVGGATGDSYSYTLGGTGASLFSLTTSANIGTLSAGAAGVNGSTNGALYALTLSTTDHTSGLSSPAQALDVVVGASSSDIISLASLSGSLATATPTFVYGMAGNDTINGAGMTGRLLIDGGAGADTMTGGSGVNTYMYGATSNSVGSAMDVITNFSTSKDIIDLTGLGSTLKVAGALRKTSIAAHSVGWQSSGGNTYVYVNTSSGSESLASANMKIDLQGSLSLSTGNISHL
jgi:hypothetical protein